MVDEITAAGGRAVVNGASVSSWSGAEQMIQQAVDEFGRLDVLVNNAGILRDKMSFNMDEAEWDAVIDVHLKGHFAPSRFAASYWRARSKETGEPVNGKIVNTASESGLYGNAGQANYAAAKAGIASMTIVMARELERIGVRVNAIAPTARTRLTDTVATGGFMDKKEGEFDRFAPENISAVVGWLASDLSEGVTGQVVKVMGGQVQLLAGWRPVTQADADTEWTIASIDADRRRAVRQDRQGGARLHAAARRPDEAGRAAVPTPSELVRDAFLATAAEARGLIASRSVAAKWNEPSALDDLTVGAVAGHLARAAFVVIGYLDASDPDPDAVELLTADQYFEQIVPPPEMSEELHAGIRARAAAEAAEGHDALLARLDAMLRELDERLATEPAERNVEVAGGLVLPLDEYLVTRMVELVVHSDDLAASVGARNPEFDPLTMACVIGCMLAMVRRPPRRHRRGARLRPPRTRPDRRDQSLLNASSR